MAKLAGATLTLFGKVSASELYGNVRTETMPTMIDKPPRTELNCGNIPAELRELDQWVVWRWEYDEEKAKWKKPPFTLGNSHAASTKPDDWTTLETVALGLTAPGTPFDGAGFTLTKNDPYVVIDLDHCRDRRLQRRPVFQPAGRHDDRAGPGDDGSSRCPAALAGGDRNDQ